MRVVRIDLHISTLELDISIGSFAVGICHMQYI